jgi:hypothetical protein
MTQRACVICYCLNHDIGDGRTPQMKRPGARLFKEAIKRRELPAGADICREEPSCRQAAMKPPRDENRPAYFREVG